MSEENTVYDDVYIDPRTDLRAEQRTGSGRHPVSVGHLVMGLAFLGLVAVWALIRSDVVDTDNLRWLLPVPWVVAGAAGLLATTLSGRRRRGSRQTGWVTPDDERHHTFTDTTEENR